MEQLLPCPFCGSTDIRVVDKQDDPYVWCKNTECPIYDVEVYFSKWNNRPSPWIPCTERIPELNDGGVLVYFSETYSAETVHIEDYFKDIGNGTDSDGNQLYTKWYICQGVTHWMPVPPPPTV